MAIQNNAKDKPKLTPEEEAALNTPIPDDATMPTDDPVDDVIDDPNEPTPPADDNPDDETQETDEEKAAREEAEAKAKEEEDKPDTETPEQKASKEKKTEEDKNRRYQQQRQESELLNEQRKGIISAIDKSEKIEPPTEEELKAYVKEKGGDWDILDDFQKNLAKDNLIAKRQQAALNEGLKAVKDVNEWQEQVDTFISENESKQTYKELIGREEDFKQWCLRKASTRGIGWEYLVPSFLHDVKQIAKKKGSMLLHGGGGEKPKPATEPGVISDANQVAQLRVSNPKEYRRLSKEGKIRVTAE